MKIYHIGLAAGTNDGLCRELQKLGEYYEINTSVKGLKHQCVNEARAIKPDFIFMQIQSPDIIDARTVYQLKQTGAKIVNWTGDVRQPIPQWYVEVGAHIDYTLFSNEHDVIEFTRLGLPAKFVQIGYDPEIFTPKGIPTKVADIIFAGNHYGEHFPLGKFRENIAHTLKRSYSSVAVFGSGWNPTGWKDNGIVSDLELQSALYRGCKIGVNCSHFDIERYSSDRILRIMGSGAFCLTHHYKGIEKDYVVGEHLATFTDMKDLINKVEYYLNNDTERERIAKAGHEHTLNNFTWAHMVKNIMAI